MPMTEPSGLGCLSNCLDTACVKTMRNIALLRDELHSVVQKASSIGGIDAMPSQQSFVDIAFDKAASTVFLLDRFGKVYCFSDAEDCFRLQMVCDSNADEEGEEEEQQTTDDDGWFSISFIAGTGTLAMISHSGVISSIEVETIYGLLENKSNDSVEADAVGVIEGGVASASWSPDQSRLVLVTNNNTLLCMSCEWDVLEEISFPIAASSYAAAGISWRGDGEAFAVLTTDKEDGIARMRLYNEHLELTAVARNVAEGPAAMIMKGLGGFAPSSGTTAAAAAVGYATSGSYIAVAQERVKGKLQVALVERNGLRHGDFDLVLPTTVPATTSRVQVFIPPGGGGGGAELEPEEGAAAAVQAGALVDRWEVVSLDWDLTTSVLAVGCRAVPKQAQDKASSSTATTTTTTTCTSGSSSGSTGNGDETASTRNSSSGSSWCIVQLYYRENYHWYCKQQWEGWNMTFLGFDEEKVDRCYLSELHCPRQQEVEEEALNVLRVVDYVWEVNCSSSTSSSSSSSGHAKKVSAAATTTTTGVDTTASVAVVDGGAVLLTPLGIHTVPPPMSKYTLHPPHQLPHQQQQVSYQAIPKNLCFWQQQQSPLMTNASTSTTGACAGAGAGATGSGAGGRGLQWGLAALLGDRIGGGSSACVSNMRLLISYGDTAGQPPHFPSSQQQQQQQQAPHRWQYSLELASLLAEVVSPTSLQLLENVVFRSALVINVPAADPPPPPSTCTSSSSSSSSSSSHVGRDSSMYAVLLGSRIQVHKVGGHEAVGLGQDTVTTSSDNTASCDELLVIKLVATGNDGSSGSNTTGSGTGASEPPFVAEQVCSITGFPVGSISRISSIPFASSSSSAGESVSIAIGLMNAATTEFEVYSLQLDRCLSGASAAAAAAAAATAASTGAIARVSLRADFDLATMQGPPPAPAAANSQAHGGGGGSASPTTAALKLVAALPEPCVHLHMLACQQPLSVPTIPSHESPSQLQTLEAEEQQQEHVHEEERDESQMAAVLLPLALSSRHRLYCGESLLASGVSSFAFHRSCGLLLYTTVGTRPHLHFTSLAQLLALDPLLQTQLHHNATSSSSAAAAVAAAVAAAGAPVLECAEPRPIERGARLICCAQGVASKVCLQVLPRGNLECIEPRPLILLRAQQLILQGDLLSCLVLLRKQRVDLNYLIDFAPRIFLDHCAELVQAAIPLPLPPPQPSSSTATLSASNARTVSSGGGSGGLRTNAAGHDLISLLVTDLEPVNTAVSKYTLTLLPTAAATTAATANAAAGGTGVGTGVGASSASAGAARGDWNAIFDPSLPGPCAPSSSPATATAAAHADAATVGATSATNVRVSAGVVKVNRVCTALRAALLPLLIHTLAQHRAPHAKPQQPQQQTPPVASSKYSSSNNNNNNNNNNNTSTPSSGTGGSTGSSSGSAIIMKVLQPILCTLAKQRPPRLVEALRLIRQCCHLYHPYRDPVASVDSITRSISMALSESSAPTSSRASTGANTTASTSTASSTAAAAAGALQQQAIRYLAFVAESAQHLFEAALGACDYPMARAVARQGQMDPKQYLPLVDGFESIGNGFDEQSWQWSEMQFRVNVHLKRHIEAVQWGIQSVDCILSVISSQSATAATAAAVAVEAEAEAASGGGLEDVDRLLAIVTDLQRLILTHKLFEQAMPALSLLEQKAASFPPPPPLPTAATGTAARRVGEAVAALLYALRYAFGVQCAGRGLYREAISCMLLAAAAALQANSSQSITPPPPPPPPAAAVLEVGPLVEAAVSYARVLGDWRLALAIAARFETTAAAAAADKQARQHDDNDEIDDTCENDMPFFSSSSSSSSSRSTTLTARGVAQGLVAEFRQQQEQGETATMSGGLGQFASFDPAILPLLGHSSPDAAPAGAGGTGDGAMAADSADVSARTSSSTSSSNDYSNTDKVVEAAQLCMEYFDDPEAAVAILCTAQRFLPALQLALRVQRRDLLTEIATATRSAVHSLLEVLPERGHAVQLLAAEVAALWEQPEQRLASIAASDATLLEEMQGAAGRGHEGDGEQQQAQDDTASEFSAVTQQSLFSQMSGSTSASRSSSASSSSVHSYLSTGTSVVSVLSQRSTTTAGRGGGGGGMSGDSEDGSSSSSFAIEGLDHALLSRGTAEAADAGASGRFQSRKTATAAGVAAAAAGTTYNHKGQRSKKSYKRDQSERRQKRIERSKAKGASRDVWGVRREGEVCSQLLVCALQLPHLAKQCRDVCDVLLLLHDLGIAKNVNKGRAAAAMTAVQQDGGDNDDEEEAGNEDLDPLNMAASRTRTTHDIAGRSSTDLPESDLALAMRLQSVIDVYIEAVRAIAMTQVPVAPLYPAAWLRVRKISSISYFQDPQQLLLRQILQHEQQHHYQQQVEWTGSNINSNNINNNNNTAVHNFSPSVVVALAAAAAGKNDRRETWWEMVATGIREWQQSARRMTLNLQSHR